MGPRQFGASLKSAEPELADTVQDGADDAGAWMWRSVLPAVCCDVNSQPGPPVREVTSWECCKDLLVLNKMRIVFVLKSDCFKM